jgi:hypothetical protein
VAPIATVLPTPVETGEINTFNQGNGEYIRGQYKPDSDWSDSWKLIGEWKQENA